MRDLRCEVNFALVVCFFFSLLFSCTNVAVFPELPPSETPSGLGSNQVNGVFVDANTIYAATSRGLSVSQNGGMSWTNYTKYNGLGSNIYLGMNMFDNSIESVFVTDGTMYVATYGGGLSVSKDSGKSWKNYGMKDGLGDYGIFQVFASGTSVYAATQHGLSVSTSGGTSWTNITATNGIVSNFVTGLAVTGGSIFVTIGSTDVSGGLSISNNAGSTWNNKSASDGLAGNDLLGVRVIDGTVCVCSYSGLSVSKDNGITWTIYNKESGLGSDLVKSVSGTVNTLYVATSGGVSITEDGGSTWRNATTSNGLGSNNINDILESPRV